MFFLHQLTFRPLPSRCSRLAPTPTRFYLPPSSPLSPLLQAGADARSALTDVTVRQLVLDRRYCALAALEQAGQELGQDLGPGAWGLQLEPAGLTSFVGPDLPLARERMLVQEGLCRRQQALSEETAAAVTTTVDALTVTCSSSGSR